MAPTSKAFVTVLFLSLALCQITAAEPSLKDESLDQQILRKIRDFTSLSINLQTKTERITDTTATDEGKQIPRGFNDIGARVIEAIEILSKAPGTPKFTDQGAQLVVDELEKFVEEQQQLHTVLIRKRGIPKLFPFFKSIRDSLWTLQDEFKSFKTYLIGYIPKSRESAAKDKFQTLNEIIERTISNYGPPSLTSHGDSPVEAIQEALTTFLQAQQALLNVLIGNRGITTYAGDLA